ncbi:MAG TPA: response regulator [Aliidongia sp.]|nr:response regulator [Aliidongia sp.]
MTFETRRNKIVLVVDDTPANLHFTQSVLEGSGYVTLGAQGGPEGISMALGTTPHVVLLDVEMPMIDGYETCRLLRKHEILRHIPIMFLTSHKTDAAMRAGTVAGGNDFMVKPFDPHLLVERIDHWAGHAPID